MTSKVVVFGILLFFSATFFISVLLPWMTIPESPSEIFRARTELEEQGRQIYKKNGCHYCHTQFIRSFDWNHGAQRIAKSGDYIHERPHL
ncbi:MAG TPA: cbb3-type cytochrome c oxidase subunit II, partial [Phnomibacter sp.]|nr:cbb3-type cytochrome c oxidase subunit II [Phnomibacter sp.]